MNKILTQRFCTLFIVFLLTTVSFSQTDNYKNVIQQFETNYNAEKYDEIFNSFSIEMKEALPLENTKQFLIGLKTQFGKIERKEFLKYEQESYVAFKTTFKNAILVVNISLDNQNKINGFFIKPYEELLQAENKTVNSLNSYPKEIAESIFSNAKEFPNNTQLSIAILQNGKVNYYGIIKENDSIKPIINQSKIFEIGSITKVFTSTVLASLVIENKIKLTDYVNTYYDFPFKENAKISFESLANHTSGLPRLPENLDLTNESNPYKNYSKQEFDVYLEKLLHFENDPLKAYSYSNLGTGLLGNTLGLSQKTTIQELVQKRVFEKYKMKNSFTNSQNLGVKLVKGLNTNGEIIPNWDFDVLFGGGGILSTTEDLAKFANAQFDSKNKELALTRKSTFVANDKMKIGLGWHILKTENTDELFWHNGGTGGYCSSMTINLENNTSVIILSNVSAFHSKMGNIDKICFDLINQMN